MLPDTQFGSEFESVDHLRVRLVAVDPHPLVRWALGQICAGRPDLIKVGEAAGGNEAIALCFSVHPDVVTIDDSLPGDDSWQLAARLRATYPDLGIVILSANGSDQTLFRALDVGASAFVSKSAPVQDVVAAIRGAALAPSSFSAAGLAAALRRRHETTERTALSPRERQILFLLHDGLSVPEIAAQLYVSLSTAKTYVTRLYDKLGARNRAQALMTAMRQGMFEGHAPDASPEHAYAG
jgi:DNA-binding NarL/FixJ family response regulator